MLDKSVAYKNIIMKMDADLVASFGEQELPNGFSFRFFEAGDEVHWARIETSVLEFETEQKALEYFEKKFLPHLPEAVITCPNYIAF